MRARAVGAIVPIALVCLTVACGQSTPAPSPTGTPNPQGTTTSGSTTTENNPAGDIPDNQAFVPFTPPGATFQVSVPEGWAQRADGTATVFTDKLNSLRIESAPAPSAPTAASANATELPRLATTVAGYQPGSVTSIQRKAGTALLITYGARSAPDPVTGKTFTQAVERYEFWRGGTEVTLTLSSPQGSDNVDPWRTITDSFAWRP